jgi:hypothetical protein
MFNSFNITARYALKQRIEMYGKYRAKAFCGAIDLFY